jgi:hypothetical protein
MHFGESLVSWRRREKDLGLAGQIIETGLFRWAGPTRNPPLKSNLRKLKISAQKIMTSISVQKSPIQQ